MEDVVPERLKCGENPGRAELRFILRRKEKAVTAAAKSVQFTTDESREGPVLPRKQKKLAGDGVVRRISSPKRVASVPNLYNSRARGQGTWVKG